MATEISDSEKVLKELENSAPEWFLRAFSHLTSELKGIRAELSGIPTFKNEVNESLNGHNTRITDLELKTQNQEATIKKLQKQIAKMETYSRQQNLLLDGIVESPSEVLAEKVGEILTKDLKVKGVDEMKFARIHRIGKPPHLVSHPVSHPRTIIIRFESVADRDKVWKASWQIRDKKFMFREDFPDSVRENRKQLLPCFKAAKRDASIKHCLVKGDTLMIDGKYYTMDDCNLIPERFKWHYKGQKYLKECDSTFFFGRDSFLSNHYSSPFQDGKTQYNCVEQYYLRQKSLYFDDVDTANAIMGLKDPSKMKALSHHIRNLDEKIWSGHASAVMENACYLKFWQNSELKEKLIGTKGNIVEANRKDDYFSCGLSLADPNIKDVNKWKGLNILDNILTTLREKFIKQDS